MDSEEMDEMNPYKAFSSILSKEIAKSIDDDILSSLTNLGNLNKIRVSKIENFIKNIKNNTQK